MTRRSGAANGAGYHNVLSVPRPSELERQPQDDPFRHVAR